MSSVSLCFSPDGLRRSAFNATTAGDLRAVALGLQYTGPQVGYPPCIHFRSRFHIKPTY